MTSPACPRASIDAHFAGRLSPDREQALRSHLPGCAACRAYYGRHLVLAELDPSAKSARARIAAGLGLATSWQAPRAASFAWATCAAAAALLLLLPLRRPGVDGVSEQSPARSTPGEFTARGIPAAADTSHAPAPPARLTVYRIKPLEALTSSASILHANEDLAFAYANSAGYRHLLVFGVDEHRHVYWYYPAWTNEAEDPQAVDVASGADVHELPEAIRHPLDGQELTVFAVFLDEPLSVRQVEAVVARERAGSVDQLLPLPAAYQQRLHFAVDC